MEAMDALRDMVNRSGKTQVDIARRIGRNDRFVINTFSRGSLPRVDTFSLIAKGCGFKLILRSDDSGDEITIDPPPTEDIDNQS